MKIKFIRREFAPIKRIFSCRWGHIFLRVLFCRSVYLHPPFIFVGRICHNKIYVIYYLFWLRDECPKQDKYVVVKIFAVRILYCNNMKNWEREENRMPMQNKNANEEKNVWTKKNDIRLPIYPDGLVWWTWFFPEFFHYGLNIIHTFFLSTLHILP